MTKDELLTQANEWLIAISGRITNSKDGMNLSSELMNEGRKAYSNGLKLKDNPYNYEKDKGVTHAEDGYIIYSDDYNKHLSWDTGIRIECFVRHSIDNENYHKYLDLNDGILSSDNEWEELLKEDK